MHDYVGKKKVHAFREAADVLMSRLADAAKGIGEELDNDLAELAKKVRVNVLLRSAHRTEWLHARQAENSIAVLWEGPVADDNAVRARQRTMQLLDQAISTAEAWLKETDQRRRNRAARPAGPAAA